MKIVLIAHNTKKCIAFLASDPEDITSFATTYTAEEFVRRFGKQ
jgi:hypothetical protein